MGRRGPKPEPTALKLERGNPGHRKLNAEEPDLPLADAATAQSKSLTGDALEEWHYQLGVLTEKGVLSGPDLSQFRQYCWMFGEVADLERHLAKMKRWTERREDLSSHLSKLHARLTQQAAHFGITPSSRSGVKAVPVVRKDPAATKRERFFGPSAS